MDNLQFMRYVAKFSVYPDIRKTKQVEFYLSLYEPFSRIF